MKHINPTQINSNTTHSASKSNDIIKRYNEKRALTYKIRKNQGRNRSKIPTERKLGKHTNHGSICIFQADFLPNLL